MFYILNFMLYYNVLIFSVLHILVHWMFIYKKL